MKALSRHLVIIILVILSTLSLFSSVKGISPLNVLIIANPNYVTLAVDNGVSFESKVSGGTTPYFYEWNFGDFGTESTATPNHIFNYAGVFNVSLFVTDSTIPANSFLAYTTVTVVDNPLKILITANANYVSVGNPVGFNSSVSGGTFPYNYTWRFGDFSNAYVANPTHAFSYIGVFNVSLLVTDSETLGQGARFALVYTTVTVVASNATANFFNVSGLPGSISVIGWLLGLLSVALFVFGAWKFPLAIFISGLVAVFLGLQLYSETHSLVISGFMWLFAVLIVFFGVFRVYSEYSPGE